MKKINLIQEIEKFIPLINWVRVMNKRLLILFRNEKNNNTVESFSRDCVGAEEDSVYYT